MISVSKSHIYLQEFPDSSLVKRSCLGGHRRRVNEEDVFVPRAAEITDATALLCDGINGDALGSAFVVTKLDDSSEVIL